MRAAKQKRNSLALGAARFARSQLTLLFIGGKNPPGKLRKSMLLLGFIHSEQWVFTV